MSYDAATLDAIKEFCKENNVKQIIFNGGQDKIIHWFPNNSLLKPGNKSFKTIEAFKEAFQHEMDCGMNEDKTCDYGLGSVDRF